MFSLMSVCLSICLFTGTGDPQVIGHMGPLLPHGDHPGHVGQWAVDLKTKSIVIG